MKTLPLALLGGLVTSLCYAAPSGQLNHHQLVITGVEAPVRSNSTSQTSSNIVETHAVAIETETKALGESVQAQTASHSQPSSPQAATFDDDTNQAKKTANNTFFIAAGEAPFRAMQRWFETVNITKIAYSLTEEEQQTLLTPLERSLTLKGELPQVIVQLGASLTLPLQFDVQNGVAAVHTLNVLPQIQWVHGATLKEAIANLTRDYHWQWQDSGIQPSWLSHNDYPLMANYGIVTPRGAFDLALDTVLDGYPVQAQLIPGSRQIFIREKQ